MPKKKEQSNSPISNKKKIIILKSSIFLCSIDIYIYITVKKKKDDRFDWFFNTRIYSTTYSFPIDLMNSWIKYSDLLVLQNNLLLLEKKKIIIMWRNRVIESRYYWFLDTHTDCATYSFSIELKNSWILRYPYFFKLFYNFVSLVNVFDNFIPFLHIFQKYIFKKYKKYFCYSIQ